MKPAFRLDLNRCTGCGACVVACANENRLPPEHPWRQVVSYNDRRHPALPVFHLSLACNHCETPACLAACPAGAYRKDPATGAVTVDPALCLGCRYCSWVCPFDAPRFRNSAGTMEKCTFCLPRLQEGREPACVAVCPAGALQLDCAPGEAPVFPVPGFPESELEPSIRFLHRPWKNPPPRQTASATPDRELAADLIRHSVPPPKITLRSEWTLLLFTTLVSLLGGFFTAAALGRSFLPAWLFLAAGLLAMAVSASHLGRPFRSWRAPLNFASSWLSREIVFFSVFLGAGFLYLLEGGWTLAAVALVSGLLMLYSIDRLYQIALRTGPLNFHSAHTLFNALYLSGLLLGQPLWAGAAGLLKLYLYLRRKVRFYRTGRPWRPVVSAWRITAGFLLPLAMVAAGWPEAGDFSGFPANGAGTGYLAASVSGWSGNWSFSTHFATGSGSWWPGWSATFHFISGGWWLVAALAVLGDLIDRAEFYQELDVVTPRRYMANRLLAALAAKSAGRFE